MKIGIFGGTFNPPHQGHLQAARAAIAALALDRLYVIPTKTPPHKILPEGTPAPEVRYHLAQILFAEEPVAEVLDLELQRPGLSYTLDTVLEIRRLHPESELYLLLGTDMFLSLDFWDRVEELLPLVTPSVFARADGQREAIVAYAKQLQVRYGAAFRLIDHEVLELSSTEIREILSARGGLELVGEALYSELIRGRYYDAKPDFAWLREKAFLQNPRRQAHTEGTEEEAIRLATYWGADVGEAREAAILHDITKGLDSGEQLRLCEKYGMMPDIQERENGKLLHAISGAGLARAEFGVCEAVFEAILYHTTGRPGMTLLDKVLYTADYIEPNRNFAEVSKLRELAYTDLDAAVAYGLALTAEALREKGAAQHPRSKAAAEWFLQR